MSASRLRAAVRGPASSFFRANASLLRPAVHPPLTARAAVALPGLLALPAATSHGFSSSAAARSEHQEESFEEFSAR